VTFVTAFARSVSQLLMSFKAFATALSTQVTSKVFSLNLAMTGTFLFPHLMCRALDGVTAELDVPGLSVQKDGAELFLDTSLQVVLLTLCDIYKTQLGNIDLLFLDKIVLEGKPI
jgi:hypothetical protein